MTHLQPEQWTRAADWRDISRRLDEFRRNDFRYVRVYLAQRFPNSASQRYPVDVPFVDAYARELMPHYNAVPSRIFLGEPEPAAEMRRAYETFGINAIMRQAAYRLAVQQTVIALWLPYWADRGPSWSVRLFSPWETEVYPSADAPHEIGAARAVRLRAVRRAGFDRGEVDVIELVARAGHLDDVPLSAGARDALRAHGSAAVWASDGAGVYGDSPALPLGRYPAAVARLGDPEAEDFFSPLPRILHDAQLTISAAFSDADFRSSFSGSQLVAVGIDQAAADKLAWGYDRILGLTDPSGEGRIEAIDRPFDAASHHVRLSAYMSALRQLAGLRPESYSGHAVTADAKLIEGWVQQMLRADIANALREFEDSMARAAAVALGWRRGMGTAPLAVSGCRCKFTLPQPPRNDAQMMQAVQLGAQVGVVDLAEWVSDRAAERGEDISPDEAKRRVAANRALYERAADGEA